MSLLMRIDGHTTIWVNFHTDFEGSQVEQKWLDVDMKRCAGVLLRQLLIKVGVGKAIGQLAGRARRRRKAAASSAVQRQFRCSRKMS